MIRRRTLLGGSVLLVLSLSGRADEAAAVKSIEKQGGKVTVDDKRPSKPVVSVFLAGPEVTDVGLKELKQLKNLRQLDLWNTEVTDAGLKDLKELKSLQRLVLFGAAVTDAGLKELKELKSLHSLDLSGTKVTDEGVADLLKARPKLTIRR